MIFAPVALARPLAGPPAEDQQGDRHQQEVHQSLALELAEDGPLLLARLIRLSATDAPMPGDCQALTLYAADLVTLASILDGPEVAELYQVAQQALDGLPGGAGQPLLVRLPA